MTYRGSRFFPLDLVHFRHGPSNGKILEGTVLSQLKRGTVVIACASLPGKVRVHPSCVTYAGEDIAKSRWRENFPAEAKRNQNTGKGKQMNRFKKGDSVIYTSGMGFHFTARVEIAHKDSDCTIQVLFRLKNGRELPGFYGQKHRVPASMVQAA